MMKKMAILGIRGIPAQYGGFETFADEISQRLIKKGVDVTVYCEKHIGDADMPEIYNGVRLAYIVSPKLGPLSTIIFDIKCLWHARKSFDIVYMLGYGASLFAFIPRLFGSKVWINMDGLEWVRTKWSKLARSWLKFSEMVAMYTPNVIIADAYAIYDNLKLRYKYMPKYSVIPYGAYIVSNSIDSHIEDFNLTKQGYYLIVCRLEPENNVLEIIQGYLKSNTTYPLVILGDCSVNNSYIGKLLKYSSHNVRFIGTIYDKLKLQSLRANCLGYFHGHTVGGTNPSLLEAMGCGSPVIAHNNPFNQEVLGDSGLFFNKHDCIPSLMIKLENDLSLRDQMISRGYQIIKDRYTWEIITNKYLELCYKDK